MTKFISILTLILGILLLVYMITVEREPGALPLFLIVIGTVSLLVNRYRTMRNQTTNK